MNREQMKELLPIIQAFVDGKQIQFLRIEWEDINKLTDDLFINPELYRIKPEPKYRLFKNAEECWQEMQKHQPFGWIKKTCGHCNFLHIMELYSTGILINNVDSFGSFRNLIKTYDSAFC